MIDRAPYLDCSMQRCQWRPSATPDPVSRLQLFSRDFVCRARLQQARTGDAERPERLCLAAWSAWHRMANLEGQDSTRRKRAAWVVGAFPHAKLSRESQTWSRSVQETKMLLRRIANNTAELATD